MNTSEHHTTGHVVDEAQQGGLETPAVGEAIGDPRAPEDPPTNERDTILMLLQALWRLDNIEYYNEVRHYDPPLPRSVVSEIATVKRIIQHVVDDAVNGKDFRQKEMAEDAQ